MQMRSRQRLAWLQGGEDKKWSKATRLVAPGFGWLHLVWLHLAFVQRRWVILQSYIPPQFGEQIPLTSQE